MGIVSMFSYCFSDLKGDSGGPLVCKRNGIYELVGVASRTGAADCSTRPSVYTRVSKYVDWINSLIN